ncbi:MAG: hypothetical protein AB1635_09070 [Acidobacteriota bacterium]
MARLVQKRHHGPVLSAARTWIHDCLVADRSLFSTGELWTLRHLSSKCAQRSWITLTKDRRFDTLRGAAALASLR